MARGFLRASCSFPLVRVGDFATLNYGKGMTESTRRPGAVTVYGSNGPTGFHDEALVRGPGVILGRKGMGHLGVEWCDGDYWVIDTAYYLTVDSTRADLRTMYYLFRYIGLDHLKEGTSNPSLQRPAFYAQLVPLPPLSEQRAISSVLRALDDKIELNRRMNGTLETMAQALFKSWFVDFDPVRAKAKGRQPEGMDAATAALLPDGFEESELGEIPRGWTIAFLGDVVELAYGKPLKDDDRHGGRIPVYGANGRIGWHDEPLVKGPGIVVGRKGNPGVVTYTRTDFWPIDTTFYVVPSGGLRSMHYLARSLATLNMPSLSADSAVPGLNRNIAYRSRLIVPPLAVIAAFDSSVDPFIALRACSETVN